MSTHDQLLDYGPLEHQQRRLESGMTHHGEVMATDRLRRALLAFQTARLYLGADPAAQGTAADRCRGILG